MSDIVKLREWADDDGWDGESWPEPPSYIESRIDGDLRARILAKIGRPTGDPCELRIIEGQVPGGWSEYTPETDCDITVQAHNPDGTVEQLFVSATSYSTDYALSEFLKWAGVE